MEVFLAVFGIEVLRTHRESAIAVPESWNTGLSAVKPDHMVYFVGFRAPPGVKRVP
jgi:hypothetical protein